MVTLTLTAPPIPVISLVPTSLAFSATQGGSNPAAQVVNISNVGTGTLNWSVSSTASWLSIATASGTAPGVIVRYSKCRGAFGSYIFCFYYCDGIWREQFAPVDSCDVNCRSSNTHVNCKPG